MEGRAVTLELLGTNELEIAYLAGIFDGEGCISIVWRDNPLNTSVALRCEVGMTDLHPLSLFQRIFGGSIKRRVPTGNYKLLYHWQINYRRAETLLHALEPYLTVKKEKANLALSLLVLPRGSSPRKLELAELITPHRTKNQNVIPH